MSTMPSTQEMERAYQSSDPTYDGVFYLAVRTTGIFCRPSCQVRKPLAKNVEYYPTVKEALFAGYRPCKRCHPLEPAGSHPDWVEKLLAEAERMLPEKMKDPQIRAMEIDPARARRYFLKNFGMTFHAYCRGLRMSQALDQIREGAPLDDVTLGHGYDSFSGFREAFGKTFGQTPGRSRETDCIRAAWIESPLGPLVAGSNSDGICLLEFTDRRKLEGQFATIRKKFGTPVVPGQSAYLEQLKEELTGYFAGKRTKFEVPLVYPGSPFQTKVWDALLKIPYGETRSYEELARGIGHADAQRAVGRTNGLNRIAIVIPCHRVVNKDGKLGGYGGGLWRKQYLLNLEQTVRPSGLFAIQD